MRTEHGVPNHLNRKVVSPRAMRIRVQLPVGCAGVDRVPRSSIRAGPGGGLAGQPPRAQKIWGPVIYMCYIGLLLYIVKKMIFVGCLNGPFQPDTGQLDRYEAGTRNRASPESKIPNRSILEYYKAGTALIVSQFPNPVDRSHATPRVFRLSTD
jgi:hypothetical protein